MSEWITDRLPTALDATPSGNVWVCLGESLIDVDWSLVSDDTPWQPIPRPGAYIEPKKWTVKWDASYMLWRMERNGKLDHYLSYANMTPEAAQRIADVYNEVMP